MNAVKISNLKHHQCADKQSSMDGRANKNTDDGKKVKEHKCDAYECLWKESDTEHRS